MNIHRNACVYSSFMIWATILIPGLNSQAHISNACIYYSAKKPEEKSMQSAEAGQ